MLYWRWVGRAKGKAEGGGLTASDCVFCLGPRLTHQGAGVKQQSPPPPQPSLSSSSSQPKINPLMVGETGDTGWLFFFSSFLPLRLTMGSSGFWGPD